MRRLVKRSKIMYMHPFYNTITTLIAPIQKETGWRSVRRWMGIASNVNGFRQVNNDDSKAPPMSSNRLSQMFLSSPIWQTLIHSWPKSFAFFHTNVLFQSKSRGNFRSCSEVIHLPTPAPFVRSYVYAEALASRMALAEPWAANRAFRRN